MLDKNEILKKVTEIARDVFERPRLKLNEETSAAEIDEWDSLTHLALLDDIQNEFHIKFTLSEISGMKNIGELLDVIMKHLDS